MTRINVIHPKHMYFKHVMAEYRELPRVFSYVRKHGVAKDIKPLYHLGEGHVKFFTNKLKYLLFRYNLICDYLSSIGCHLNYTPAQLDREYWDEINDYRQIEWYPNILAMIVNYKRLIKRKPDYYLENIELGDGKQ